MRTALIIALLTVSGPALANSAFRADYENTVLHADYFNGMVRLQDHCLAADRGLSILRDLDSDIIAAEAYRSLAVGMEDYAIDDDDIVWMKMQRATWSSLTEQQKLQCK